MSDPDPPELDPAKLDRAAPEPATPDPATPVPPGADAPDAPDPPGAPEAPEPSHGADTGPGLPEPASPGRRLSLSLGVLVFGFGMAGGFLTAFSGLGFLAESAGLIVAVFLILLVLVAVSGATAFFARGPILRFLFGVAQTQLQVFATPLAEVTRAAARRDVDGATESARNLLQLALARYSWVATRRWVIASLTGLIAAMAALAGTALLFNQNKLMFQQNALIQRQSDLMLDQNRKIEVQSALLEQDVQLAEAARNAQVTAEIATISGLLGDAMDRARKAQDAAGAVAAGVAGHTPLLDPETDMDQSLIMRLSAASQSARPYRFLDVGRGTRDPAGRMRAAMQRRRAELPATYAALSGYFGWQDPPATSGLTDRPASPERGQLLRALVQAGVHQYALLDFYGLDLSFALAPDITLALQSFPGGRLSFADLRRAQIVESDFRGAELENARFLRARIERSRFDALPSNQAPGPYRADGATYPTALAGADFSQAILRGCSFDGAQALAAVFDGALIERVSFRDTDLGAASFRGAALVKADFTGANLKSVELDGAYVFAPDALAALAETAAAGSFRADRFETVPVAPAEVLDLWAVFQIHDADSLAKAAGGAKVWRIRRVGAFEK